MATKPTSSTNSKKKGKMEAPAAKPAASAIASTPIKAGAAKDGMHMVKSAPTHDDIAERAFALYQARGGAAGAPMQDWLNAERELSR